MQRKIVLSLFILASAGVTTFVTLRVSIVPAIENLLLHGFFLVDVFIRPPSDGVDRETPGWAIWGKILMLSLVYLPLYDVEASVRMPRIADLGIGLTFFGAVLALWGRVCLGRMGTSILTIIKEPLLCKEGLYRFIRHPIYSGFSIAFLGHQVTFLSLPGLIIWLLFTASFLRKRIQVEEEMLVEQFREDYLEYRQNTWKMFPYIY